MTLKTVRPDTRVARPFGPEKMTRFAAFLAAGLFALAPAVAGDGDFDLVNQTGQDLAKVFLSPNNGQWDANALGDGLLQNGDNVIIELSRGDRGCIWDLRGVFSDQREAVWQDIDLCKYRNVTLKYEGNRPGLTVK